MRATAGNVGPEWPPLHTPAASVWPPVESLPRPRMREEEGELSTLMRGMMNAQANDIGWPTFSGKYVEYPPMGMCATSWCAAASRKRAWPATSACW
jgi:hypothetical protein